MPNANTGTVFSAGIGLALGLTMANYMLPITKSSHKIVKTSKPLPKCGNKNPIENRFCSERGQPLYPPPQVRCSK